jgi:hypothetical protein
MVHPRNPRSFDEHISGPDALRKLLTSPQHLALWLLGVFVRRLQLVADMIALSRKNGDGSLLLRVQLLKFAA